MAAYMTHCELQPSHLIMALKTAQNLFYKLKNFKTASAFAKRLIEMGPKPEVATQSRKVSFWLQRPWAKKNSGIGSMRKEFDWRSRARIWSTQSIWPLCSFLHTYLSVNIRRSYKELWKPEGKIIFSGKQVVKCPLSGACYLPQYQGEICRVTKSTKIGEDTVGLRISAIQFR